MVRTFIKIFLIDTVYMYSTFQSLVIPVGGWGLNQGLYKHGTVTGPLRYACDPTILQTLLPISSNKKTFSRFRMRLRKRFKWYSTISGRNYKCFMISVYDLNV
jgi:hypothetical protein